MGCARIVTKQSITAADVKSLNNNFGSVLTAASASPAVVDGLKSAVFQLATQVDTASPQPAYLASNDYSLILQTALSIGRPMPAPILPKIVKGQGIQADATHIKTPLKHPALVGTYHFHTHIQVVTLGGEVVGTTNCRKNNQYKVVIDPALSPGTYQFRIRAYDDGGNLSRESRVFEIKVMPRQHQRRSDLRQGKNFAGPDASPWKCRVAPWAGCGPRCGRLPSPSPQCLAWQELAKWCRFQQPLEPMRLAIGVQCARRGANSARTQSRSRRAHCEPSRRSSSSTQRRTSSGRTGKKPLTSAVW